MSMTNRGAKTVLAGWVAMILSGATGAQIAFEDATEKSNIHYVGMSWGGAWGDYNNDGLVDFWLVNHKVCNQLYRNNGDGSFTDVPYTDSPPAVCELPWHDSHGSAWADFDNDGDADLVQLVDNSLDNTPGPSSLFVNRGDGTLFDERAAELGVDYEDGRGRTPLWLDWNRDGLLDLLHPSTLNSASDWPTALLEQLPGGGFTDVTAQVGLDTSTTVHFAINADLNGDGRMELLYPKQVLFPGVIYDTGTAPFKNIRTTLGGGQQNGVLDVATGDFDNDGDLDLFAVRGEARHGIHMETPNRLEAHIDTDKKVVYGFEFVSPGDITIDVFPHWLVNPDDIFIGAWGYHPGSERARIAIDDPDSQGIIVPPLNSPARISVGLVDPATGTWRVLATGGVLNFVVEGVSAITGAIPVGFELQDWLRPEVYWENSPSGLTDVSTAKGFVNGLSGRNVVTGDFDNDMDLDLYLVSTGPVTNLPNRVLENVGGGNFVDLPGAGGAAGTDKGRGDAVAMADYDNDGFLDLIVTNGKSKRPFEDDGPVEVFHNLGNANHWLEIDLEGVESNRDAIGTRARLTAGGVTQLREQNGGIHYRAQNHQRLHFGLGPNRKVNSLAVDWPNGESQVLNGITADQVIRLVEPVPVMPDAAAEPYAWKTDEGVFVWRDPGTEQYHLRVTGGADRDTYQVTLLSDTALQPAVPFSLESNDWLEVFPNGFALTAVVSVHHDGVDFTLPATAHAMIAVQRNGQTNPRLLHVGASRRPLSPSGWILRRSLLSQRRAIELGQSLGFLLGLANVNSNTVELRAISNGPRRNFAADLFLSAPVSGLVEDNIESGSDSVSSGFHSIHYQGLASTYHDGIDFDLAAGDYLGIAPLQEGMFQAHRVDLSNTAAGFPNAAWLQAPAR